MPITLKSSRGFEYLRITPFAKLRGGWEDSLFDVQLCYSRWDEGEPTEVCHDFVTRIARVEFDLLAGLIDRLRGGDLKGHDDSVDLVDLSSDLRLVHGDTNSRMVLSEGAMCLHVSWRPSASFEARLLIAMDMATLDLAAEDFADLTT